MRSFHHKKTLPTIGLSVLVFSCVASMASAQVPQDPPTQPVRKERDRWAVKTATDPMASEINTKPVKVTVEELLDMKRPLDMSDGKGDPKYQNARAKGVETTVYVVEAKIIECRLMPDGDYRVQIQGKSGKTMYIEMPDPAPDVINGQSRFQNEIAKTRNAAEKKLNPQKEAKQTEIYAKITGVGFFGWSKNMKGQSQGNGIQLHPILKLDWLKPPKTADPKPDAVQP